MNELEAQVRCLEAALVQAKNQGDYGDINIVVDIQKRFYTLVIGAPESAKAIPPTEPEKVSDPRPKQADKSPDIFRVTPKK